MHEILVAVNTYGPLVMSILGVVYLFIVKVSHIDEIKATLVKMDEKIEGKLDTICNRQIDHEGRISRVEGVLYERHKTN